MVGPIAPERNPPINPEYYAPRRFEIANLLTGINTTITTEEDHDYVIGQLVRVLIPTGYGSTQISGQSGYVISIPAEDQVVVTINSQECNAFIASPLYTRTPPQIMAIGDVNTGYISSTGRIIPSVTIPGSFINISPL